MLAEAEAVGAPDHQAVEKHRKFDLVTDGNIDIPRNAAGSKAANQPGTTKPPNKDAQKPETSTDPVCILGVELDGQQTEKITVRANQDPEQVVEAFGQRFNLSENAKRRLLEQIHKRMQAKKSSMQSRSSYLN